MRAFRTHRRLLVVAALLRMIAGEPVQGQPAPVPSAASAHTKDPPAEHDRLWQEAQRLDAAGEVEKSIAVAEQSLAVDATLAPQADAGAALIHAWIAERQLTLKRYSAAIAHYQQCVEILAALPETKPWQLVDARLDAKQAQQMADLPAADRQRLEQAEALIDQAFDNYERRAYTVAVDEIQRALDIVRDVLGENHDKTAAALTCLAVVHEAQGEYARAITLLQQALDIRQGTLGEVHPDTAILMNGLASLYELTGQYARALPLFERALAIRTETLGEEHLDTATSLNNLAMLHSSTGDCARALPLCRHALAIVQLRLGDNCPETASLLNNVAHCLVELDQNEEAQRLYQQSLAIRRETLGDDHPDTADSLNNLAYLDASLGDYARALPLYEQSLAIRTRTLGANHPDTAASLNNLGDLFTATGEYERAAALYEQSLAIRRQIFGDEHPDTAASLNNLASLYVRLGDYARALPLYEQARKILFAAFGPEHSHSAGALNNLGLLYETLGEYDRALPLYEQALAIHRKLYGEDHVDTALSLGNLACLYDSMGDPAQALPLCEQSVAVYRRIYGDNHPATATSLNNLASVCESLRDYGRALALYEQALAARKRIFGDEHPDVAAALANLAYLHDSMGHPDQALQLYRQAYAMYQQTLGEDHVTTAKTLFSIATLLPRTGDVAGAADALQASADGKRRALERQLFSLSDVSMRSMLGDAAVVVYAFASLPLRELGRESEACEALLATKAMTFEALNLRRAAADLAQADEDVAALRRRLLTAQRTLESLVLRPPEALTQEELHTRRATLFDECRRRDEQLNRQLAAYLGTEPSLAVSLADVRAAMPANSAHVEFFYYFPSDFDATGDELRCRPPRYAAFVLRAAADSDATFVDLGPAAAIEALIDRLGDHIRAFQRAAGRFGDERESEDEYRAIAVALSSKLIAPLRQALGGARQVSLGPDGRLHELAFEALVDGAGTYLIEAGYQFAYVNSGRDLLRRPAAPGVGVCVIAGPDFGLGYQQRLAQADQLFATSTALAVRARPAPAVAALAVDAPVRAAETRLGWRDLGEAALQEGDDAAAAFAEADLGPVVFYSGSQALEEVVKRLVKPRVLVLVTHGDYLQNQPTAAPTQAGGRAFLAEPTDRGGASMARGGLLAVDDPFLRSYLVLAGANQIDEPIPANVQVENGWLTAREIAQLDLRGTDLVVLSACSSNRGQSNNGEAVAGMRSAFLFAGARSIVGSLFEVPNAETRQLLKPFYEGVAAGVGKLAALNDAKLQFIRQRRAIEGAAHPFYWASFILVGEP